MSAVALNTLAEKPAQVQLRAVPMQPKKMPMRYFVMLLFLVMVGLLMLGVVLSNAIQADSVKLGELQMQESELRYQEAALSATAQDLRSSSNLAQRAWDLGMRPNPHPAFIEVSTGNVLGKAEPVRGNELRGMVPVPAILPAAPKPEPKDVRVIPLSEYNAQQNNKPADADKPVDTNKPAEPNQQANGG